MLKADFLEIIEDFQRLVPLNTFFSSDAFFSFLQSEVVYCGSKDAYLEIKWEIMNVFEDKKDSVSDSVDMDELQLLMGEGIELELDASTSFLLEETNETNVAKKYLVVMDVMLHPTYGTTTPYIQIFDSKTGALILDVATFFSRIQIERGFTPSVDEFECFWLQEEHYYKDSTVTSTLHVCTLSQHLDLLDDRHDNQKKKNPLALLQFISLIGPMCGMLINPQGFELARKKLDAAWAEKISIEESPNI